MSPLVQRNLPNSLTMLRLVLAAAFFITLDQYWYDPEDPDFSGPFWANVAIVIFILAAITDALDGYLARKWKVESLFGRIMDPVCDKVLVLGAFVYLAGPRFLMPAEAHEGTTFAMATGVYSWMVVVILFRELLVTGIRSIAEARGVRFASNWWGKAKMILQTVAIPIVILIAANFDPAEDRFYSLRVVRDVVVWGTLAVTVLSGVPYVLECASLMNGRSNQSDADEVEP